MSIARVQDLVRASSRIAVLTGAGISTESGIPDYRSPGRPPYRPLQHREFMTSEYTRKRYWARSLIGYPKLSSALPNAAHFALADFAETGKLATIITQNVDCLHQKAGAEHVLNLHGSIHEVVCLQCRQISPRAEYQHLLLEKNPQMQHMTFSHLDPKAARPDGDVELTEDHYRAFNLVHCPHDQGWIKPNVTFFGDNIPEDVVAQSYKIVDEADMVMAVGTSLQVWSALRLVRRALSQNKPAVVLTRGPTRADDIATVKLEGLLSELLPQVLVS
eukprot:m.6438 g.6438  ORF g.6438 m.6438 type:complete len:275 (-) comp4812_c0_seq2:52-876(-)